MVGGNQRQQDSQGCIRCCANMEKNVTEGESVAAAERVTSLILWLLTSTLLSQPVIISQPRQHSSSSTNACLHAASSVYYRYTACLHLSLHPSSLSSGLCSQSGLIKITLTKKKQNKQKKPPNYSSTGHYETKTIEKPTENML